MNLYRTLLRKCAIGVVGVAIFALAVAPGGSLRADVPGAQFTPPPTYSGDSDSSVDTMPPSHGSPFSSWKSTGKMIPFQAPASKLLLGSGSGGCTSFTNVSSQTVARVVLLIVAKGKSPSLAAYASRGPFAPGDHVAQACAERNVVYAAGSMFLSGDVGVTPIEVDYADGSAWHAGADTPELSMATGNADVTINRTFAWRPEGECVSFSVSGTRPVKHVQIAFSHPGAGSAVDILDVNGSFTPGSSQEMNCRQPASPIGSSSVTGSIRRIDYQDGTAWLAPASQDALRK